MKKKKYEDLSEIMYQALEYRGEPVYRKQSSRYGTLVTGCLLEIIRSFGYQFCL